MISRCANYAGNVVAGIGLLPKCAGKTVSLATEVVSGLFFTVLSAVTFGKIEECNRHVNSTLRGTPQILPTAFGGVLRVLNGGVVEEIRNNPEVGYLRGKVCFATANRLAYHPMAYLEVPIENEGPEEGKVEVKRQKATLRGRANCFIKGQIGSRFAYALLTAIAVVYRVADFIIGVIAAAASLICLGQNKKVNEVALKNLTIFGVVNDISDGVRGIVNPQQKEFGYDPFNKERRGLFYKDPKFFTAEQLKSLGR